MSCGSAKSETLGKWDENVQGVLRRESVFPHFLIEILVVIGIIGLLVADIASGGPEEQEKPATQPNAYQIFCQLGIAHGNYEAAFYFLALRQAVPGLGISLHVMLLPFIEQASLYDSVNFNIVSGYFL